MNEAQVGFEVVTIDVYGVCRDCVSVDGLLEDDFSDIRRCSQAARAREFNPLESPGDG